MVITIECSSCHAAFPVDPAKIPEKGVKVRCSSCGNIFRVERPAEDAEAAASPGEARSTAPDARDAPDVGSRAASPSAPAEAAFAPPAAPTSDPVDPMPEAREDRRAGPGPQPEADPSPDVGDGTPADETEVPGDDPWMVPAGAGPAATDRAAAEGADGGSADDDWVFETEPDIDPDALDIQPVGTVEETVAEAKDEAEPGLPDAAAPLAEGESPRGDVPATGEGGASAKPEVPQEEGGDPGDEDAPTFSIDSPAPSAADAAEGTDSAPADPEAPAVAGFTFGQRDPREKARRLARVLVSDMIMYNPDRHERALANGTLRDDFEEEIAKSWREYVDQVGEEMAETTDYWTRALNDVLAKGDPVF